MDHMYYADGKYKFVKHPERSIIFKGTDEKNAYYITEDGKLHRSRLRYRPQAGWNFTDYGRWFYAYFPDKNAYKVFIDQLETLKNN